MLIAQVTDPHIKAAGRLAYRTVDSAQKLRDCVAHLNALDPRPDIVLLTGDLVDLGRPEEYAVLREILAPLAAPVYVIPGNHDERGALRAAFSDHAYLRRDPSALAWLHGGGPRSVMEASDRWRFSARWTPPVTATV